MNKLQVELLKVHTEWHFVIKHSLVLFQYSLCFLHYSHPIANAELFSYVNISQCMHHLHFIFFFMKAVGHTAVVVDVAMYFAEKPSNINSGNFSGIERKEISHYLYAYSSAILDSIPVSILVFILLVFILVSILCMYMHTVVHGGCMDGYLGGFVSTHCSASVHHVSISGHHCTLLRVEPQVSYVHVHVHYMYSAAGQVPPAADLASLKLYFKGR